ncbi:DEAD/DEAH box helicase [Nocardia crassostreae]|uniref:DEAD/DEAH box helicase n=1 Tax=Nocardia crassostreae TaxID=53428 RepID=UPI000ADC83BE|nr:DEAD/DEAH box helicase family protein [Nocardia crassostreae]
MILAQLRRDPRRGPDPAPRTTPLLTTLVESAYSTLNIDDNRTNGSDQTFTCASELRPEQRTAMHAIEAEDTCVLVAPPGTGKTVIACAAIASRSTSTLILVDRKALADQWRTRILEHLAIKCGQIGGGRSKTTGVIDVALLPTLARRTNVDELTGRYGFVVVDECHHIAASAFTDVLNQIPARYWLGLTATPYRRDQLDDLIYHQLGSHTHTIDASAAGHLPTSGDTPAPHRILHVHPTRFAYDGKADPSQPGGIAEIYRALVADEERLKQIVTDVLDAHQAEPTFSS